MRGRAVVGCGYDFLVLMLEFDPRSNSSAVSTPASRCEEHKDISITVNVLSFVVLSSRCPGDSLLEL